MNPQFNHNPDRLDKAGIPLRFRSKTLKSFVAKTPRQQAVLDWSMAFVATYQDSPAGAILIGQVGSGKTHIAIGIALAALLRDYVENVQFMTAQRAIRRIQESWKAKPGAESEREAREAVTKPRLLILDEVGMTLGTEFESRLMFELLNDRHEAMKPTILISNLNREGLETFLGPRVIDRLREDGGKMLTFDWPSHRGTDQ